MKKLLLFFLFIAGIVVLYFYTPVGHYLSPEGVDQLRTWIQSQGALAPFIFSLIYIIAVVFALPGSILTISGGVLFGTGWGTLINILSATVGATLAFWVGRYLGRGFVERRLKGKVQKLDEKIHHNGFYAVLYLRLVPLVPFNALNFSLGLTKVKLKDYVLGSLIGMAPGAFVYTSLGGASHYIDLSDPKAWLDYRVWGPFVLVLALSLLPKLISQFKKKAA